MAASLRAADRVARITNPDEIATVTYVSESADYIELRYPDGFAFRSRASEWKRPGDEHEGPATR